MCEAFPVEIMTKNDTARQYILAVAFLFVGERLLPCEKPPRLASGWQGSR